MELVAKSKEAALSAIRVFNDPQVSFKSETFIVLMVIAWTYLLHAYYRGKKVEYRYFRQPAKRKIFDRTRTGAYKYWELERCLNDTKSPVDTHTANNLRFLISLRHEIEHQMTRSLDNFLSGRYQACALNYNTYAKKLFGARHGIDSQLTYSIQFLQLADEQISGPKPKVDIPARLMSFVAEFDGGLSHDEYNDARFSYRLLFTKKLANRPGQADRVIEFIDPKSELAKTIDKEYWVKKEVERPKFRPKDIVKRAREAGFPKFRLQPDHVELWRAEDAKNPAKGFGTDISGTWFWYESWLKRVLELCDAAGDEYR
ncbi:MAG: DUF3644 domain-containing protein [Polyangiaceae bacterium]